MEHQHASMQEKCICILNKLVESKGGEQTGWHEKQSCKATGVSPYPVPYMKDVSLIWEGKV